MAAKKKTKSVKSRKPEETRTHCEVGMCNPQRIQGLKTKLKKGSSYKLISIRGTGLLLAGHVSKQGGANDLTFVSLEIDGESVVNSSFAAAGNWGLTQSNPYGIVLLKSGSIQNFTFGWPVPLSFKKSLELSVIVKEAGVVQIVGNIIRGSSG